MPNRELLEWIKSGQEQGYTEPELIEYLLSQGYTKSEIAGALNQTKNIGFEEKIEKTPHITFYLVIGLVLVLLIGVIFFITSFSKIGKVGEDVGSDVEITKGEVSEIQEKLQELVSNVNSLETTIDNLQTVFKNTSTASAIACVGCIGSKQVDNLTAGDILFTLEDAAKDGGCTDCITWSDIKDTDSLDSDLLVVFGNKSMDFDNGTLFIDGKTNRVGISNTDPRAELDIKGSLRISGQNGTICLAGVCINQWPTGNITTNNTIITGNVTAKTNELECNDCVNATDLADIIELDGSLYINTGNDDLNVDSGTFFVDGSENRIGIGTTTPARELHLQRETENADIRLQQGASSYMDIFSGLQTQGIWGYGTNSFVLATNSKEAMRISNTGMVGIATANPKSRLQVSNGDIYLNDSTRGIILTSPNGTCFRVTVANAGNLLTTQITCP